jgi:hypothetical protein
MDPLAEVRALKGKRDALKKELLAPDLNSDEKFAIYNRIIPIENQITMFSAMIPPPPDTRGIVAQWRDAICDSPLTTCVAITAVLSGGYWWMWRGMEMRQKYKSTAYTDAQIEWRRRFLKIDLQDKKRLAVAKKVALYSAGMLLLREVLLDELSRKMKKEVYPY